MMRKHKILMTMAFMLSGLTSQDVYAKVGKPGEVCLKEYHNCYNLAFPDEACDKIENKKDSAFCAREYNLCLHDYKTWTKEDCRASACVETFKYCAQR